MNSAPTTTSSSRGFGILDEDSTVTIKPIKWLTNYNGKLGCAAFVHIDLAPAQFPPRKTLDRVIFEISTDDHSHPPVKARLYDMLPLYLWHVGDCIALASHGIDAAAFMQYLKDLHPGKQITADTMVVIYQYQKLV